MSNYPTFLSSFKETPVYNFKNWRQLFSNSDMLFVSLREPSIIWPRNLTGWELMDGIKSEKSVGVNGFFMLNGVEFLNLPLIITMLQDLCVLKDIPAQVSAVVHENRSLALATEHEFKLI